MFKWLRKKVGNATLPEPSLEDFQSHDINIRRRAIQRASYQDGNLSEAILMKLLKDNDAEVREGALEYCQWHHPPGHTDYLVAALSDPVPQIRWKAARHLYAFPTPKAAEHLRQLFNVDDPQVKNWVIHALGKCEDGQSAPFLFTLLTRMPPDSQTITAGVALGELKATAYTDALIQLLSSPEPLIVEGAVWALGSIGDRRATAQMLVLLARNHANGPLAHKIVMALNKLGDPDIIVPLLPVIEDERFYLRTAAMNALSQFRDDRITSAIEPFLSSDHPDLRATAANALTKIGGEAVINPLLDAFERETHPRIRIVFVRALARLDDQRAIQSIQRRRASADDELKREIDKALVAVKSSDPPSPTFGDSP